ncbi:mannose-1-phosphate guanylyltransferase [Nakamurella aerolata]|uniref:NTP transferase domain-containing protein n=1 Tax=Nakamurella aerolata TaxID=1656892 RepID=A0A849A9K3_9ACTN|nr:mannose-1-phosphate guanylyltransferase [Nakamurella aerolata]NNG36273.1 NTP transferase domain-containing protein [Nakamurella aerolata]
MGQEDVISHSGFWAVIPAGGSGTRLWPLSRSTRPKFLLDLLGTGRTLLQQTVDRLRPLCGDQIMVVTGESHIAAVREQLPDIPRDQLVTEPSGRDSMPAIGLAAALIERIDPEAVIGSFAADHVVGDSETFEREVGQAISVARQGFVVTIGIEPSYPATEFGYIRAGESMALPDAPAARAVASFVEKPDGPTAAGYLESGEYRWNAGMYVVKAGVLLDLLAEQLPAMATALREIAADPASMPERWPQLTKITIDHAVAEPAAAAGRMAVVPGDFQWDDIGSFGSLARWLPRTAAGTAVLGDQAMVMADGAGVVIPGTGRLVATIGTENVVVVDTPDALLVTTVERAQDVKRLVDELKATGRVDLT